MRKEIDDDDEEGKKTLPPSTSSSQQPPTGPARRLLLALRQAPRVRLSAQDDHRDQPGVSFREREREREREERQREERKLIFFFHRHTLLLTSSPSKKKKKKSRVPVRAEMRSYFLSYLCTQAPTLQPFVAASLCQLLARLVEARLVRRRDVFGCCRTTREQRSTRRARRGDRAGYALMLRLLAALVAEFNAPSPGRTLTQHR